MHAPAVGSIARDLVLHGGTDWLDLGPFASARLDGSAAPVETTCF